MPNRPVRDQCEYPKKMVERHFPIKPGQPKGMTITIVITFSNFLIRAKNRFVKNGTADFGRNTCIPTGKSGPPPWVIPNIPVGRDRNGPFHLNSDRNFRNLWHNGKHPSKPFFSTSKPVLRTGPTKNRSLKPSPKYPQTIK